MTDAELVQRLEKLERDNRRLKGFAVAVLAVAAALTTIYSAQPVPEEITAHRFDVVDSAGKTRVRMDVLQGVPRIELLDEQGIPRVAVGVSPEGDSHIALLDTQGYSMDLGHSSTVAPATGETQQRSAASIVMYGNDEKHRVIWRAP